MQRKYILSKAKEISLSPNRLQCSECKKQFWMTIKYLEHMASHNLLVLSCNICCKGFYDEELLDQHYLTHDDIIKPYSCKECPIKFIYKHKLEQHKQCHIPVSRVPLKNNKRKSVHFKHGLEESKDLTDNHFKVKEGGDSIDNEDIFKTQVTRSGRVVKNVKLLGGETLKQDETSENQSDSEESTNENSLQPEKVTIERESNESLSITKKLWVMAPKIPEELLERLNERKGSCILKDFKDRFKVNDRQISNQPSNVKTTQPCSNNKAVCNKSKICNNNSTTDTRYASWSSRMDTKRFLYVGSMEPNFETIQSLIQKVDVMSKRDASSNNASSSLKRPVSSITTAVDQIPEKVAKVDNLDCESGILDKKVVDNFILVKVTPEYMEEMKKNKVQSNISEIHPKSILSVGSKVDSHLQSVSSTADNGLNTPTILNKQVNDIHIDDIRINSSNDNSISSNCCTQLVKKSISDNLNNEPICSKNDSEVSLKSLPVVVKIPIKECVVQDGKKHFAVNKSEIYGNTKVCEKLAIDDDGKTTDHCSSIKKPLPQSNDAEKNNSAIIENKAISITKENIDSSNNSEKIDQNIIHSSEVSKMDIDYSSIKDNKSSTFEDNNDLTKQYNSDELKTDKNKSTIEVKILGVKNQNDTENGTKVIDNLDTQSDKSKHGSVVDEYRSTSTKVNIDLSGLDKTHSVKYAFNSKNSDNNDSNIKTDTSCATSEEKYAIKCLKPLSIKKDDTLPVDETRVTGVSQTLSKDQNENCIINASNSEGENESPSNCKSSLKVIQSINNSQRSEKYSPVCIAKKEKFKNKCSDKIRNTIDIVPNVNTDDPIKACNIEENRESNITSKISSNFQSNIEISHLDPSTDSLNAEKRVDLTDDKNSDTELDSNNLSSLSADTSPVKDSNVEGDKCLISCLSNEKVQTDTGKQLSSSITDFTEQTKMNKRCFVFSKNIEITSNNSEVTKSSTHLETSTLKPVISSGIPCSSNVLWTINKSSENGASKSGTIFNNPAKCSELIANSESSSISGVVTLKHDIKVSSIISSSSITNHLSNSVQSNSDSIVVKTVKGIHFKDTDVKVSNLNKSAKSVDPDSVVSVDHKNENIRHNESICKEGVVEKSTENFCQQNKKESVKPVSGDAVGKRKKSESTEGIIKFKSGFKVEDNQQIKKNEHGEKDLHNISSIDSKGQQIQLTERILELYKAKMEEKERKKKEKYELKKKQRFKESQLKGSDDSINVSENTKELPEKRIQMNQQNVAVKIESKGNDLIKVVKSSSELREKECIKGYTTSASSSQYSNVYAKLGKELIKSSLIKNSNPPQNVKSSKPTETENKSTRMSEKEAIEKVHEISLNFEKPVEEAECLGYLSELEEIISVYNIGSKCSFIFKALRFCRLHVDSYEVKERAISLHQMITKSIKKP